MEAITKYWCFMCKRECEIKEKETELICTICHSTFIEEIENTDDNSNENPKNFVVRNTIDNNSNPNTTTQPYPIVQFQIFTSNNGRIQTGNFNTNNLQSTQNNPFQIIMQQLNNFLNFSPNLQINTMNYNNNPLSNFLFRHNNDEQFENLLNYLMINDPNRYGKPPASKKAINQLPREKINEQNISKYMEQCTICVENYEIGQIVTKLNCSHYYHDECLISWLNVNNACPICRQELVTDDADYENSKNEGRRLLRDYNSSNMNRNNDL